MSRPRTILCPCEDVELEHVVNAVEHGYDTIETLKRSTGAATGPCQGQWCLRACIEALAQATGRNPETIGTITHRPPVHGVPLAALGQAPCAQAHAETEEGEEDGGSEGGGENEEDEAG